MHRGSALPLLPFLLLVPGALPGPVDVLMLDTERVLHGELWRLFTAHYVHLGPPHLLLNLAALAACLAWAVRDGAQTLNHLAWFFVVAAPLLSLALMLAGTAWYAGLSGLLHGAVILLLMRLPPAWCLAGLAIVVAKLAWQFHAGTGGAWSVSQLSHWLGAALGLAFYLVQRLRKNDDETRCEPA